MEPLGCDLPDDKGHQNGEEQRGPNEVTAVIGMLIGVQKRHRDRIAAGLTERRGGDLDDPKGQRDLWNFAEGVPRGLINCVHAAFHRDGTTGKKRGIFEAAQLAGQFDAIPSGDLDWSSFRAATRQEARPIATPNGSVFGTAHPAHFYATRSLELAATGRHVAR
jgi:hypothetical protein